MSTGVQILYNGQTRQVAAGATVADLLAQLDRPAFRSELAKKTRVGWDKR
jgi:sulfur carrier protein ThiS